jgi:hypothetical protein
VVAWVALDRGAGARELLGADDAAGLGAAVAAAAAARGVPLVVPLLDLEDRAALDASAVWGGFRDAIENASARYGAEGQLVGRAYRVLPTLWEARWTLMLPGGEREWLSQGPNAASVLADGAAEVADLLASRYATYVGTGAAAGLAVSIGGVLTLEDYARTLDYLGALDEVSRLHVVRVDGDRLLLELDARGGGEAVRRVIGLGRVLEEDPVSFDQGPLAFTLRR